MWGWGGKVKFEDKLTISDEVKWKIIGRDMVRALEKGEQVIAVFFFDQTKEIFKKQFNRDELKVKEIEEVGVKDFLDHIGLSGNGRTVYLMGHNVVLMLKSISKFTPPTKISFPVCLMALEHYPLIDADNDLQVFRHFFSVLVDARFYSSLDSPLMKAFGGNMNIFNAMGLDDEAMSNWAISQSIAISQTNIKQRAMGDLKAYSSAEWFRFNCPALNKAYE